MDVLRSLWRRSARLRIERALGGGGNHCFLFLGKTLYSHDTSERGEGRNGSLGSNSDFLPAVLCKRELQKMVKYEF